MKFKPGSGKVLVKVSNAETVTSGGIVLADPAIEQPTEAVVLAVGKGKESKEGVIIEIQVAVDDRVMFSKGTGQPVKLEGEDYLVLREEDIFAVIED